MTTTEKALLMTRMRLNRIKSIDLAAEFKISGAYVSDILNGRREGPKAEEWIRKFDKFVASKEVAKK
ncbi:MAG: transcriptional regulator [Lactobacillus sp.]|jgi:predicted transcriptional regulator|nr:transcriptional regulator [Lactobacillus sp.]